MADKIINLQYTTIKDPLPDFIYKNLEKYSQEANSYHPQPLELIERLAERPEYKLRIGNYRVIVDINQSINTIEVTLIGHRKDVYSKLQRK